MARCRSGPITTHTSTPTAGRGQRHYRRDEAMGSYKRRVAVRVVEFRVFFQLLCDVTAKKSAASCSTFLQPHLGQMISSLSCSLMVRITSNEVWQSLQTYS